MVSSNLFGFQFAADQDGIRSRILAKHRDTQDKLHAEAGNIEPLEWNWLEELYSPQENLSQLVLTTPFVNAAQLIRVRENPEYKWLAKIPLPGVYQYNFGHSFIRFRLQDTLLSFCFAHKGSANHTHQITLDGLTLDLEMLPSSYPTALLQQTGTDLLLQLLTFQYLGPVETTFLAPRQRFMTRRHPDSLFNKSSETITVLDSRLYAEHIKKNQINWALCHYAAGDHPLGRRLEKRPNTISV